MQRKSVMILFFFIALVALSYGDQPDKCIKFKQIPNFDINKGLGVWYPQLMGGPDAKNLGECLYYNTISNTTSIKSKKNSDGVYTTEKLTITQEGDTSKFIFRPEPNKNIDNWVVDIDYTSYLVYYQCDQGKGTVIGSTRKRIPDPETMKKLLASMKKNGFSVEKPDVVTINQNGCTN